MCLIQLLSLINPLPHPVFSLFIHTVMDIRFSAFSILTNASFRENEILTYVSFFVKGEVFGVFFDFFWNYFLDCFGKFPVVE